MEARTCRTCWPRLTSSTQKVREQTAADVMLCCGQHSSQATPPPHPEAQAAWLRTLPVVALFMRCLTVLGLVVFLHAAEKPRNTCSEHADS
jgi:hypothetical protein